MWAWNFRPSPNFSAGATRAPVQLLPPWGQKKSTVWPPDPAIVRKGRFLSPQKSPYVFFWTKSMFPSKRSTFAYSMSYIFWNLCCKGSNGLSWNNFSALFEASELCWQFAPKFLQRARICPMAKVDGGDWGSADENQRICLKLVCVEMPVHQAIAKENRACF